MEENDSTIYSSIIHSIKGKSVSIIILIFFNLKYCEEPRKRFVLSRSTLIGKFGDTSFSQENAKDFINCHAYILNLTKTKCKEPYEMVFDCISKEKKENTFPQKCVNLMQYFINCK